jgi:anti-anti-sigma factor
LVSTCKGQSSQTASFTIALAKGVSGWTISAKGELDLWSRVGLLRAADAVLIDSPQWLVIDLSAVSFIDAAGLGTVLRVRKAALAIGCVVLVCNAGPRIRRVFELTQLSWLLSDSCAGRPDRADPRQ